MGGNCWSLIGLHRRQGCRAARRWAIDERQDYPTGPTTNRVSLSALPGIRSSGVRYAD
jgi:hypothetical protein